MNVIEGTGAIVIEPDWESLFSDDSGSAKSSWRRSVGCWARCT